MPKRHRAAAVIEGARHRGRRKRRRLESRVPARSTRLGDTGLAYEIRHPVLDEDSVAALPFRVIRRQSEREKRERTRAERLRKTDRARGDSERTSPPAARDV